MSKLLAITKNELLRYFISPLAYVYLVAFLLLNGSFAVYFGGFTDRAVADLSPMFIYQPWLYLLFIPGISMRLWSEEFRSKTIIQLLTLPVGLPSLVWGKFLASWIFSGIALCLTFPFWITVNVLGSPDNSIILISYIGSWILAGCMLAISQTMSALTKNQVIALVLSVIANFLFFLSGVEYVLGFFRLFSPEMVIDMIASFSFITHFSTIIQGLFELRDILFFASIIVLFNITTTLIVSFKTSGTSAWLKSTQSSYYVLVFILLLLGFLGINLAANSFLRPYQYDFTEEKIYTITPSSQKILEGLAEPVIAKLYYSPILGQRSPEVRLAFDNIRLLLQRFEKLYPEKFSYKIYNPNPLDEVEDQAIAAGLQPIPLVDLSQNAFMGLVLVDAVDNKQIIPFFPMERQGFLEHDIVEKIYQLHNKKKMLGLISALPVMETQQNASYLTPQWNIISEIKKFYDIKMINTAEDLSSIDVLMIIHPQAFSDELVNGIKKYSDYGGKTLLLLDTATEARRIFSPVNIEFYPSDLKGLDLFWGFRFYNEVVVVDLENSITVDATKNYASNPIFTQDIAQFKLPRSSFNPDFSITKNINSVLFASASPIMPAGNSSLFLPLITAGAKSGFLPATLIYEGKEPNELLRMFKSSNKEKFLAALLVSKREQSPFEVIVVGDTDFAYDTFWSVNSQMLENNYLVPIFDNANFILNSLDYLSRENSMMDLRGKAKKRRPFEGLEIMRKENMHNFRLKENEILDQIDKTKIALNEIFEKRKFEERESFNSDELALIAGTRKTLENLKKQLSSIRQETNKNIELLSIKIKIINIYLLPLGILLALLLFSMLKSERKSGFSFKISANKELAIVASISTGAIIVAVLSLYFGNTNDISTYENKIVFEDLSENLNTINQISLKSSTGELILELKDGIWIQKDNPCAVIFQERIKRFLFDIANATYYEKKSDKVEYLAKFGLEPIETKNSSAIRVELSGGEKPISFDVGKYDIDIGRGARAAYIKFDNRFQVWMIRADLVDLSTNIADWSYSSLWNLRFGRLQSFNNNSNLNRVVLMVKELLGAPFIGHSEEDATMGKPVASLELKAEDFSQTTIDFFAKEQHIYARYSFKNIKEGSYMDFFAQTANKCYYEISLKSLEKIRDVLATTRAQ